MFGDKTPTSPLLLFLEGYALEDLGCTATLNTTQHTGLTRSLVWTSSTLCWTDALFNLQSHFTTLSNIVFTKKNILYSLSCISFVCFSLLGCISDFFSFSQNYSFFFLVKSFYNRVQERSDPTDLIVALLNSWFLLLDAWGGESSLLVSGIIKCSFNAFRSTAFCLKAFVCQVAI